MILVETIDVAIQKTLITTGVVFPGDEVTFQVTVYNQSPFEVFDVQVIDYLPTGTTFVSSAGAYPFALSGTDYMSVIDSISAGGMEMIQITVQIDSDYQ